MNPTSLRLARAVVRSAAPLIPSRHRRDWLERWFAEIEALAGAPDAADQRISPVRLALGAWPDAIAVTSAAWCFRWSLHGLRADTQLALRRIRRARVSAAAIVLITGSGAATATGLFSLIDLVIVQTPPGVAAPAELLQIGRGDETRFDNFSFANFQDFRGALAGTVELAAFGNGTAVIGAGADAEVLPVQYVSDDYFRVLGAQIWNGPGLSAGTSAPAAVLSGWFAASRLEIAQSRVLRVDGRDVPVAGIAAADFVGTSAAAARPAAWLSLTAVDQPGRRVVERGWSWLWIIGRRDHGVTFDRASTAIDAVHARLAASNRATIGDRVTVVPGVGLRPPDRREATRVATILIAAAFVLWLVATANAAGLQLSRTLMNAHATAVQRALGASRSRIVRSLAIEHLILAAGGGLVAWAGAYWVARMIQASLPYTLAIDIRPDARALGFALIVSTALAALATLLPFWRVASRDPLEVLKRDRRSVQGARTAGLLVTAQVALSTVLVMSAGLLTRSLQAAGAIDPGFDANGVIVAQLRRQPSSRPPRVLREELTRAALSVPGATGAGLSSALPLAGGQRSRAVFAPGSDDAPDAVPITLLSLSVDRGFFDTLRIHLSEGSWPASNIQDGSRWPIVISRAAATRLWPDGRTPRRLDNGPTRLEVAGITGEIRVRSIRERAQLVMFLPIDAVDEMPSYVLVRTAAPPETAVPALRAALAPLASDVVLGRVETMNQATAAAVGDTRVAAEVAGPLALLASFLAAAGMYGMTSRRVIDRRREIAVRTALGAGAGAICRDVVAGSLIRAGAGLAVGLAIGVAAGTAIGGMLVDVGRADPVAMLATVLIVGVVTTLSSLAPAMRAVRIDPQIALKGSE